MRSKMTRPNIQHARLKELLHYDPETGNLTWLVARSGAGKVGSIAGSQHIAGYRAVYLEYKAYLAHRLAWFYVFQSWPTGQIDHINGVRSDNRLSNLRDVDAFVNQQNRRSATRGNLSGFLGVTWSPVDRKFRANISANGVAHSSGHIHLR